MRLDFILIVLPLMLAFAGDAYAQIQGNVETLTIPYTAFNAQGASEDLKSGHKGDWLLTVNNNLIYNPANPESMVVLRLKEHAQGEKYIELTMATQNKLSIAIKDKETSYLDIYIGENSWFPDKPLKLLFSEAQDNTISISNGQRTLVDRLKIGEFVVGTIEYHGKGYSPNLPVVSDGNITLAVTSGNPVANFPLMLLLIVAGFAAAIVFSLGNLKKRKDRRYWGGN